MLINRSCTITILLLVVLAIPSAGVAADAAGRYVVRGVGSAKCGQLVSAIDSKDEKIRKDAVLLYTSWLNGYLSHANRVEKGTYSMIPLADGAHLLAVVVGQCRSNPESLTETVSNQVIGLLSKAKISAELPLVVLSVGNQKGNFYKATLVTLQEKLIALGHFKGKPDGEFGTDSQKALRSFQKAGGLKETGFPDTDTLIRVLLK